MPSASPVLNTSGLFSISSPQMSRFRTEKGNRVPSFTILPAKRAGMRLPRACPFRSAAATRMVLTSGCSLSHSLMVSPDVLRSETQARTRLTGKMPVQPLVDQPEKQDDRQRQHDEIGRHD